MLSFLVVFDHPCARLVVSGEILTVLYLHGIAQTRVLSGVILTIFDVYGIAPDKGIKW